MRRTEMVLMAGALFLLACRTDTGDRGFGVSGTVKSAESHEPIPDAWVSLHDTIPEDRWSVDSIGAFAVATWGCGVAELFAGGEGFQTYDTIVDGRGCPNIKDVLIELVPAK